MIDLLSKAGLTIWAIAQGPSTSKGPWAVRPQAKYLGISPLYVKVSAGAVALHLYSLCTESLPLAACDCELLIGQLI